MSEIIITHSESAIIKNSLMVLKVVLFQKKIKLFLKLIYFKAKI